MKKIGVVVLVGFIGLAIGFAACYAWKMRDAEGAYEEEDEADE